MMRKIPEKGNRFNVVSGMFGGIPVLKICKGYLVVVQKIPKLQI